MQRQSPPSDTPQTPGFQKLLGRGVMPAKQISHQMVPGPHSRLQLLKGTPVQRSIGNYSKMTPADANGRGQIGVNINSMAKNLTS
jgi:hypothetical protein